MKKRGLLYAAAITIAMLTGCGSTSGSAIDNPYAAVATTDQSVESEMLETASVLEPETPQPTATPTPTPTPSPTPSATPTPTPRRTDKEIMSDIVSTLKRAYELKAGVTSSEIEYSDYAPVMFDFKNVTPQVSAKLEIDPATYPPEEFQTFVCDFLDRIADNYSMLSGNTRLLIDISYPYGSDPELSWWHAADAASLYDGMLSYRTDGAVNTISTTAEYISYYLFDGDFSAPQPVNPPECSYEEYLQIEDGMSYADVVEIIGSDGIEQSRSSASGSTAVVYKWEGDMKYSNVIVEFLNDAVISKAQSGLS